MFKRMILFFLAVGVCTMQGMNLQVADQKINQRALQGFLRTSSLQVRTLMTNGWLPGDRLEEGAIASKKKIIPDNQEGLGLLFCIAALFPHEVQKKVVVAFCNNNEKLAEDYLSGPIGALMDLKWSQDVIGTQQDLKLYRFIDRSPLGENTTKLRDAQTVFSLATEIQRFEALHNNSFKDASRSTLEAVKKIIDVYPSVERGKDQIGCKTRKCLTIGNLVKRCKKEIQHIHPDTAACATIWMWPLAIKTLSRVIELLLCTRFDTQKLIEENKLIEEVNAWLGKSTNKAIRDYQVPLNLTWDYNITDCLKIYGPFYIGFLLPFFIRNEHFHHHNYSNLGLLYQMTMCTAICTGAVFSCWVLFIMERDDVLGNAAFYLLPALTLFILKNIFFMCKQKTKKIPFNKVAELLQRTDILIV